MAVGTSGEPSLAAETYRRAVENDVVEMWYYLRSQLTRLRQQLEAGSQSSRNADHGVEPFSVQATVKHLSDVIDTGADYKRCVPISTCTAAL